MNVKLLNSKDELKLKNFLMPNISQNMFILNNLEKSGIEFDRSDQFYGYYWGCFDAHDFNAKLVGIIVHYWNGNIMMFAEDKIVLKKLLIKFRAENKSLPIAGILGPSNQVQVVLNEFNLLDRKLFNCDKNEDLFELNLHNFQYFLLDFNEKLAIVTPDKINSELLIKWMCDFESEALGEKNEAQLLKKAEKKVKRLLLGDCYVLIFESRPVSLVAFNAKINDVAQIGPVWTPKENRNKGFATLLLKWLLNKAKNEMFSKLILFSDNDFAIRIYKSLGFKFIGDYRVSLLRNAIEKSS